jgi:hypothetical protein
MTTTGINKNVSMELMTPVRRVSGIAAASNHVEKNPSY